MVICFIPFCKTGYAKREKTHSFRPSKNVADQWIAIFKKLRQDKEFDPNNNNHRVCSLHFEESLLIKVYKHIINGEVIEIPREKWELSPDAVPTIFNNFPASVVPKPSKPRRKLIRATSTKVLPFKKRKINKDNDLCLTSSQPVIPPSDLHTIECNLENISRWWTETKQTSGWINGVSSSEQINFHLVSMAADQPDSYHTIVVTIKDGTGGIRAYADKTQIIETTDLANFDEFRNEMESTIEIAEQTFTCSGIAGFNNVKCHNGAVQHFGKWFSTSCEQTGKFKMCHPCNHFYDCVLDWERSFCETISKFKHNGDIILTCISEVSTAFIDRLGCPEFGHNVLIVRVLLPYYVTMRIHFYTRAIRNALGKGKATKSKRKESKLLS